MQKIKIIHEPSKNEPFVVIQKPAGLPSAPLTEDDSENAFSKTAAYFPELYEIKGKKYVEHGLIHRLDTATEGLILIAATQEFYDFMQIEQAEGRFIKTYRAECNIIKNNTELLGSFPANPIQNLIGHKENKTFSVESYFRNFGEGKKLVRPVTDDSGKAAIKKLGKAKLYRTELSLKYSKTSETLEALCRIQSGYRHQVRCHLAWCNIPVIGDPIYNALKTDSQMQFFATGLEFSNPITNKNEYFTL
ncbi:MAG: RNA pseudouridine synthase [Treponema sp.]|nr:RNA pseudouridine synthase [Treponema sp.]